MKVKVLKPFGRFRTLGEVIELPYRQARTFTAIGKVTQDLGSQRPRRMYRRRDMVAEPAVVQAPALAPPAAPIEESQPDTQTPKTDDAA
jgi:hypothetical protein